MTKLAIVEEREEDKYEHVLALHRYHTTTQDPVDVPVDKVTAGDPRVQALVDGVMQSHSSARKAEVQAWEEERLPCEHTLTLTQFATGEIPPSGARPAFSCN
jgi:ubiquitin carboxyl-terminal hydrolase 5/13